MTDRKGTQYICRCGQVCKHWFHIVSQPLAWKIVDLSYIAGYGKANDNLLRKLTKKLFQEVKELNLSGWVDLTDRGLERVAKYCPKLERLNISNCQKKYIGKVSAASLLPLAENCSALKRVNFSNLRITSHYVKTALKFIEVRGVSLTHINFSGNIAFGSLVLTAIIEHCKELVVLDVSNTSVRNICFETMQVSCPKLQELYLANLQLEPKRVKGTEGPGFKDLRVLSCGKVGVYGWMTDALLLTILKKSPDLVTLDIRGNSAITNVGLKDLSASVERLYLSRCHLSLNVAETICRKWCQTVWDLDLSWVEAHGTQFDMLIDFLMNSAEPCSNITHLNLTGTAISDSSVKNVVVVCVGLQALDLTSCRGVSRGIKRFHDGSKAINNLRKFYKL